MKSEFFILVIAVAALAGTDAARGGYTAVAGGPPYDWLSKTGINLAKVNIGGGSEVNNSGKAVGYGTLWQGGIATGTNATRWDAASAESLENIGLSSDGSTICKALAINDAGTAVGYALKYNGATGLGQRAVRWGVSGTSAMELGTLGQDAGGVSYGIANAINNSGISAGCATRYASNNGNALGHRAVLWDTSGNAAELGHLGLSSIGSADAEVYALSNSGVAVGYSTKYAGGVSLGHRAVRWGASNTVATELDNLSGDALGTSSEEAHDVNEYGTAVGRAHKYVGGVDMGTRAVRWDGSGTAIAELDNLGTDSSGHAMSRAYAVDSDGTAVGYADLYVGGTYKGYRAVRWNGSDHAATQLGDLGANSSGVTYSYAYDISNGITVGWAYKYDNGTYLGQHAVLWDADGMAIDLNTLVDPRSGWTLIEADAISDNGMWISGAGTYDPDGAGPLSGYGRTWTLQIPEPTSSLLIALGAVTLLRRRR